MKILIETYRGWDIYFNTQEEEFYTQSNEYDKEQVKKSYSSTKKFIDDFIKENNEFKPIRVQKMPSYYSNDEKITLIGLRKDGAFVYQDEDGNKKQLSSYNECDYFLVDPRNECVFKEIEMLNSQKREIDEKVKLLGKSIIKVDVKQIRKNLLGGQ